MKWHLLWERKFIARWLWHAIDHQTGTILAFVIGRREDRMFLKLKRLPEGGMTELNYALYVFHSCQTFLIKWQLIERC